MRRRASLILTLAAVAIGALPVAAAGPGEATSSPPAVSATLDGRPMAVGEIANHYCQDRWFPVIECFSTAAALEAAREPSDTTAPSASVVPMTPAPGDYVTIYSGLSWSGAYMYVGQDYDTLAWVGWNDRIRSYRSVNAGRGIFWTDWYHAGNSLSFCCDHTASSLSSTFDQQITSVYRQ